MALRLGRHRGRGRTCRLGRTGLRAARTLPWRSHVLAAVHLAIAVGVGAATALRTMVHLAVIHGRLAGLSRAAGHLVLHGGSGSAGLGGHLMALMALRRRRCRLGLGSSRNGESERQSGDEKRLHVTIS